MHDIIKKKIYCFEKEVLKMRVKVLAVLNRGKYGKINFADEREGYLPYGEAYVFPTCFTSDGEPARLSENEFADFVSGLEGSTAHVVWSKKLNSYVVRHNHG